MRRFGSGPMTVRPEKSTRLPDKFPLNRPCFPFNLCTKPLVGLVPGADIPGACELMYSAID